MGSLLLLLGLSAALLIAAYVVDRFWGSGAVCALAAISGIAAAFMPYPVLLPQCIGMLVVGIACLIFRAPAGIATCCSLAATLVAFGFNGVTLYRWTQIEHLMVDYPFVSLEDRLAYESRETNANLAAPKLSLEVEIRMGQLEMDAETYRERVDTLRRLHEGSRVEFAQAMGFGDERMDAMVWLDYIVRLPAEGPLPVLSEESNDLQGTPAMQPANVRGESPPTPERLLDLHTLGERGFVSPDTFGYIRRRRDAAGFEPHQLRWIPQVESMQEWKIARLELVSLLKHDPPAVYVSRNLPNLDELKTAPTMPLSAFEAAALAKLRSEEDLVCDEQPDRIRMVGSLRASTDCCACHSVPRGELLGALTYVLVRAGRPPKPSPQETTWAMPKASLR